MDDAATIPDERLELIFTCCHPALALEAQVALTLRTLGGLSTEEIALAFLVPFETMSKRLTRAKHKIRDARHPVRRAARPSAPDRLAAVLAVLYLIFNEGWGGGRSTSPREAIQLGRALAGLMPDEAEVLALLALMLLHDAREAARLRDGRGRPARRPGPDPVGRAADRRGPRRCCGGRWHVGAPGPTWSRRPSPTCTCSSPATGGRSPRSTRRSPGRPARRSSS